jgi:hypothetical protein
MSKVITEMIDVFQTVICLGRPARLTEWNIGSTTERACTGAGRRAVICEIF